MCKQQAMYVDVKKLNMPTSNSAYFLIYTNIFVNLYVFSSPFHPATAFDLSVDREGWWFEYCVIVASLIISRGFLKTLYGPGYLRDAVV